MTNPLRALLDSLRLGWRPRQRRASVAADARVWRLERALERTGGGLYPTCEKCGERLDMAWLRSTPERTLCVACESARRREDS